MHRLASRLLIVGGLLATGLLAPPAGAHAATGDVGFRDQAFSGSGAGSPTGEKPESKLWYAVGTWWTVMPGTGTGTGYHLFRLTGHVWADTGTAADDRLGTRSDVVVTGNRLYVASHVFAGTKSTDDTRRSPSRLYRYSYDTTTGRYTSVGPPSTINDTSSETLTLDRDTRGVLWVTWMDHQVPRVGYSVNDGVTWTATLLRDPTGTAPDPDDISTLAAFGTSVGVLWSNQRTGAFVFVEHHDADPPTSWQPPVVVAQGAGLADDHLNLKGDRAGRLYAVVKTSRNDLPSPVPSDPQVLLLARNPTSGAWARPVTVATVADCHTRPVLVLDDQHQLLHVFLTGPTTGCAYSGVTGTIFEKTSPLGSPSFPPGRGLPVMRDAANDALNSTTALNNVTAAKNPVTSTTRVVVLASEVLTGTPVSGVYWHSEQPAAKPTASFTATRLTGAAPLPVTFKDTSSDSPTSWSWTFGDGARSTVRNPSHTYRTAGSYTVTLTARNSVGSGTVVRTGFIRVAKAGG